MKNTLLAFVAIAIYCLILGLASWMRLGIAALQWSEIGWMAVVMSLFVLFLHFTKGKP